MGGYIDIHTHLLPGVDDGSTSMDMTKRMLGLALEQQIETILVTPHYEVGVSNPSANDLLRLKDQVQEEALKLSPKLRILLGNEIFYSESIVEDLKEKKALTLADSRYVLVEFSTRESYATIFRGFTGLIRAGYLPILAHVERYNCLYKQEDLIRELVDSGCYIQMNSNSLIGGLFDTEVTRCRKLLTHGLVHLIGSDCHDDRVRTPSMAKAVKALRKKCDMELIHKIFYENPIKVIENTYI